jgi:hypothetical protein
MNKQKKKGHSNVSKLHNSFRYGKIFSLLKHASLPYLHAPYVLRREWTLEEFLSELDLPTAVPLLSFASRSVASRIEKTGYFPVLYPIDELRLFVIPVHMLKNYLKSVDAAIKAVSTVPLTVTDYSYYSAQDGFAQIGTGQPFYMIAVTDDDIIVKLVTSLQSSVIPHDSAISFFDIWEYRGPVLSLRSPATHVLAVERKEEL